MAQENKMGLTPDELAMLDRYVEFGLQNYFETITSEKVRKAMDITEADAKKLKDSKEYIELKKVIDKFDDTRKTGFGDENGKKDEKKFIKWAKKQPNWNDKDEQQWLDEYRGGKFGFGNFKNFYEWYKKQPTKDGEKYCVYCGTAESTLKKLFKEKDDESECYKPLYSKKRSFTATLQIDRKNSEEGYKAENCVLACTFCNNAKSDMVRNGDEFKNAFGKAIGDYLRKKYDEIKDK